MNTPIKISVESESARQTALTPNGNAVQSSPESYSDPENGRKDEYEKLNSDYQIRWNDRMEISGYKTSSFYLKVSVLLIAWGEDFDDLGTKKEVDSLESTFKNVFRYNVTRVHLTCEPGKRVQSKVNLALAKFVDKEDGENRLLIVYYAGHGVPDKTPYQIKLWGKRDPTEKGELNECHGIVWDFAESNLHFTHAHVLEIFDCCYAGNLGRNSTSSRRSFEYLAATAAGTTAQPPGEKSFTSALIWALNKLVVERGKFTTSDLRARIRDAPNFPKSQVPTLTDRNEGVWSRIVLAPQPTPEEIKDLEAKDEAASNPTSQEILDLRFIFKKRPSKADVDNLADSLGNIIMQEHLPVSSVIWGGLHPWLDLQPSRNVQSLFYEAVHKFHAAGRRKSFLRGTLGNLNGNGNDQSPTERLQTDGSIERGKKRQRPTPPTGEGNIR